MPSDKRFRVLFPERKDFGRMTDYKDRHIEFEVLLTYLDWLDSWTPNFGGRAIMDQSHLIDAYRAKAEKEQHNFYRALKANIEEDILTVRDEEMHLKSMAVAPAALHTGNSNTLMMISIPNEWKEIWQGIAIRFLNITVLP